MKKVLLFVSLISLSSSQAGWFSDSKTISSKDPVSSRNTNHITTSTEAKIIGEVAKDIEKPLTFVAHAVAVYGVFYLVSLKKGFLTYFGRHFYSATIATGAMTADYMNSKLDPQDRFF